MKKSPHRHRDRRRLKRIRWASKMVAWRERRARQIAIVEAMPPGVTRSLAESLMQSKAIATMDVLAGYDPDGRHAETYRLNLPLFEGAAVLVGPKPGTFTVMSNSAWMWNADGKFVQVV